MILNKKYIKSPFNYIGNKYKLLPQIIPLFPDNIDTFFDMFCGGLDVTVNTPANLKIANDINHFVIEIMETLQNQDITKTLDDIDKTIRENNLSKDNKESYYRFRDKYNNDKDPLSLYVLVCYSFNYQFRFNSNFDFNNSAGTNRSSFNGNMRNRLIKFVEKLKGIKLLSEDFKDLDLTSLRKNDFVYADPPYRASVGSYNDGKRGFEGWTLEDDFALFTMLDDLNQRGIRFAMSNVFKNNGNRNKELEEWAQKYNIHYLDNCYSNSNYQRKKGSVTKEVLITNY